ncbi:P-loop ATPase, Sll1717 family [Pseudoxanthomonas mexicana]|uniref:P-loop ATPase, Sll1717 family n=1 Tax=Pseudoxanthomonas mexicana TaxID=128785 RepID=UPI0022F3A258|nr:hypothetical protein [Pseudoxanthomonas mexicana]WBX91982.1 hypothetical protein PE064_09535 [Pseudoxanthomonas mexicana]
MANGDKRPILISKNASIGAVDAYEDTEYREECFVDPGWLGEARDSQSRRSVVLGRTGAGKSALLLALGRAEENVIEVDPSEFAFRYIENSNVIQFFQAAGVNLDLFYRLLWRHVLVVELLKKRFRLTHPNDSLGFLDQVNQWVRFNPARKAAMDYLRRWGEKFWETTEVRARELTTKFEDELKAGLKVGGELLALGADGASRLGVQEREEIVARGNEVVSGIQMRELRDVIGVLGEKVFNDERSKYFVVVDKLDENWAKEQTRYRLIRALVEEIRSFRELKNVKILAAIRQDLLLEVFDHTREAGFQEEKYHDYFFNLRWSSQDLEQLVQRRIGELYRRKYRAEAVRFEDIFPTVKRGRPEPLRYILQRTLMRPRDAIAFVNECLRLAENRERVSWKVIRAAEGSYSDRRVKAVCDEWRAHYPSVDVVVELLRGLSSRFGRSDIPQDRLEAAIVRCATIKDDDPCVVIAKEMLDPASKMTSKAFLDEALRILYKIGFLGARFAKNEPISWAFSHEDELGKGDTRRTISFHVHKMCWRGLGTRVLEDEDELRGLEEDD